MWVRDRKLFVLGLVMAVTFILVFFLLFTPSFNGQNAFQASDALFNSIAKGSTYFIPDLRQKAEAYRGTELNVSVNLDSEKADALALLRTHGVEAVDNGGNVDIATDLGNLILAALDDSDSMFHNRGEEVSRKYGLPEKQALHAWWRLLRAVERSLTSREQFDLAAGVGEVNAKGVEVAYNFYGIEPQNASSKVGILSFSLVFYVLYTLWWGYAIFYIAQGLGLVLKSGAKKEV